MAYVETQTLSNSQFKQGLSSGLPIALGYAPAAITFGFLAETTGLTLMEATAMSMFVFAGAAQYMALNLIAIGTGALEIIFTTFIVNIRHFLMAASLEKKSEPDKPLKKAGYAFGLTDEVFAVTATRPNIVTTGFIFGVFLIAYGSWVANTIIGHWMGGFLPDLIQNSMMIALYALFIALLAPAMKENRKVILLAISAALLNGVFSLFMAEGWAIVLATIAAAVLLELRSIYDRKMKGEL
nr:AzlC family ABC transporter permease [Salsuginibacillus kocurii]